MHLFECWKNSLSVFNKENIFYFFNKFFLNYLSSTKTFLKYFSCVVILDFLIFIIAGKYCNDFVLSFSLPLKNVSYCAAFFYIVLFSFWYLLNSLYFISVLLKNKKFNWHIFNIYFKKYFQIVFVTTALVQIILFMLSVFGVTSFPNIHWFIKLIIRFLEIVTLFYWLESNFKKRDIFLSIENATNFWLYNFPFFIITIILGLTLNFAHKYIFDLFFVDFNIDRTLGTWALMKNLLTSFNRFDFYLYLQIFLIKISRFFINYVVLTFIYTFYFFRKNKNYSDSVLIIED
ncbi:hypothetical protein L6269_00270 [Candidatus Dependentiae bacterium]|nr:hypothetical protein [Candidatus Dependentiae bacterium]MCG2755915.1 hypothetical protein [Candidatus Dependentiae bacterium]